jgi:hypothetical protein
MSTETEQLAALARLHEQLERHGIEYWLFGGWAVDFHAGSVTRPHDDLDIAVWQKRLWDSCDAIRLPGWAHRFPSSGCRSLTTPR